ncbi:substrate-binding domain-containing protein [bacterium]|nr:substrate-binding domain-containing protein [bacterium]
MDRNYYPVFLGREDPPFSLSKLKETHVAGVILQNADDEKYHPFVEKLKNASVPYIMVDRYALREDINYVEEYPAHEIYKAAKYLLKLGHRRIVGIGFESKRLCYNNHFYGFEKALLEEKTYDPLLIKKLTGNTEEEMLSVINDLFSGKNPPTAIFLFWSPATANLISALEKHGIKIPEDVSLMAVGHEQYAKNGLKITTVAGSSPIKFGETAANKLMNLIEGKIHPPVNVKLKLKLLEGNSCIRINNKEEKRDVE